MDFDVLKINKFCGNIYLDGYWQSEEYFKDIRNTILEDLEYKHSLNKINKSFLSQIKKSQSVALHVRFFDHPKHNNGNNVNIEYYEKSLDFLRSKVGKFKTFVFTENFNFLDNFEVFRKLDYIPVDFNNGPIVTCLI